MKYLSNLKSGHPLGGAERGGAGRGEAERGEAELASLGFIRRTRRQHSWHLCFSKQQQFIEYLSNPKPGHTTSGSGRSARRSGRAGSCKIACQKNYSPRKQKSTIPSKAWKKRRFNVSLEARTSEILFNPTDGGTKSAVDNQFITGLSPVYQQNEKRFLFVTADQWNDGCRPLEKRLFVFCTPFSCRTCPGIRFASTNKGTSM